MTDRKKPGVAFWATVVLVTVLLTSGASGRRVGGSAIAQFYTTVTSATPRRSICRWVGYREMLPHLFN